jgi:hypothetical protein
VNDGILNSGYTPPPLPRPLLGRPTPVTLPRGTALDPSAAAYLAAVEIADGQSLEAGVAAAINLFVIGCKNDGIWNAIKASCVLAGARTLEGALVPLVGPAPTNVNFVSADYNRRTGLVGNGTTKYLSTNRNNNADPQNSKHLSAFVSTIGAGFGNSLVAVGNATGRSMILTSGQMTINRNSFFTASAPVAPSFVGAARADSSSVNVRINSVSTTSSSGPSETPSNENLNVFRRPGADFSNHRIAFYSIGESLNLALLGARVTALINSLGAAI